MENKHETISIWFCLKSIKMFFTTAPYKSENTNELHKATRGNLMQGLKHLMNGTNYSHLQAHLFFVSQDWNVN